MSLSLGGADQQLRGTVVMQRSWMEMVITEPHRKRLGVQQSRLAGGQARGMTCLDKLRSPQIEHELRVVGHILVQPKAQGLLLLVVPKSACAQSLLLDMSPVRWMAIDLSHHRRACQTVSHLCGTVMSCADLTAESIPLLSSANHSASYPYLWCITPTAEGSGISAQRGRRWITWSQGE